MKYEEELGNIGNAHLTREETGTAWYAEMIIPVRYVLGQPKKNISIGLGPYFGVGLGGKISTTVKGSSSSSPSERDYFGDDGGDMKRFDMGWITDLRYSASSFSIGLEMLRGFLAISENDTSIKNFTLRLYVGVRF